MDLEALTIANNRTLYEAVKSHFSIELLENQDWREEVWHHRIEGNRAIIYFVETSNDEAAFTYQLLLIDQYTKGFKKLCSGICLDKRMQVAVSTLIKYFNHNFLDLKVAIEMKKMAYFEPTFFEALEINTLAFIAAELKKQTNSKLYLTLLYLDFVAPFQKATVSEKEKVRAMFSNYHKGVFRSHFEQIDLLLEAWKQDSKSHIEQYAVALLASLEIKNAWFSYKPESKLLLEKHFPAEGFFSGTAFTREDIDRVYG